MTWVTFKENEAPQFSFLITRSPGYLPNSDNIEVWDCWIDDFLKLERAPTHFWEGVADFKVAMEHWYFKKPRITPVFSGASSDPS